MPKINIYGYVIGFNLSTIFVILKNASDLRKIKQLKFKLIRPLIRPFLSFIFMLFTLRFVYNYMFFVNNSNTALIISIAAGLMVYVAALIATGTFTVRQISNTLSLK
jgi:stage V sporulation protein B